MTSHVAGLWSVVAAAALTIPGAHSWAQPAIPPDWTAPLTQAAWVAQPSWLANPAGADQQSAAVVEGVTRLQVAAPSRGMKWSWSLPVPASLEGLRYAGMRYRARGVSSRGHYALCLIGATRAKGSDYQVVIPPTELVSDGHWHTAWAELDRVALEFTNVTALACELQALDAEAQLELKEIRFTRELAPSPLSDFCAWRAGADFTGFRSVPLDASAGAEGAPWLQRLQLTGWPETNQVTVEGIPFALGRGAFRVAATSLAEKGQLRFPVGLRTSEVFLLLLAEFSGQEEPVYGEGRFKAIRDTDRFQVRLEYTDDTADEWLPMDAASGEFGVARSAQVLVAASDASKRLRDIVILDRTRQAAFAVAAITVRVDGKRSFPEALEETPALTTPPKGKFLPVPMRGELSGTSLGLTNEVCRVTLDLDGPPRLRGWQDFKTSWDLLGKASVLIALTVDGQAVPQTGYELRNISPAGPTNGGSGSWTAQYAIAGVEGMGVSLAVEPAGGSGVALRVVVANTGSQPHRLALTAPRVGPYRLCAEAGDAWYLFPKRGAIFDNRACAYRERYCGLFPLQFMDTFAPTQGRGLTLHTEDTGCECKHYVLEKYGAEFVLGVDYAEQMLKPGDRFEAPRTVLALTRGSWHDGFEAYRAWVGSWYQPLAPHKTWFHEIFNFRQRFLHGMDPLVNGQRIELERAVAEAQREFGGMEYLHLFDWGDCGPHGRIYGRTGDYSPFDYLPGGQAALREAIGSVQALGIPVGLYIEGYLLDERGKLGRQFGKQWQLIDATGQGARWPDSSEIYACSFVPPWREVQASTYADKAKELGPDGMYIDEYGFAGSNVDCWSKQHGHPSPGYAVTGELGGTRLIRQHLEAAKPGVAIYTEESPADVASQCQDGSFTYALSTARQTLTRVPLNLARFALPAFKTIEILYCDKPTGSWATGVKWVFFNGEAIWLEGPATEWFEPETREAIRQCHRLLRQYRDAFTTDRPLPLVPTLRGGVFVNAFPAASKTVYTLYNSRHHTVRGDVLEVPWQEGFKCEDAWHDKPARFRRVGDHAVISTELGPNDVGCLRISNK